MTTAGTGQPPSPSKVLLIRRFLKASGVQLRIDSGSFLDSYAFGVSPMLNAIGAGMSATLEALRDAYQPHRMTWQEEYESHVDWEFTETELEEIVAFLEGAAGQHFLEGRWRMDAYIGTNTEHLLEEIIEAAAATLAT